MGLKRTENQDSLSNKTFKDHHIFVVCDGVSGLPNGKKASQVAAESILTAFTPERHELPYSLQKAMDTSQATVMETYPKPMGTTIAAICLFQKTAYIAWCGDSRIYYFSDGSLKWMSRDHNVLHDILNKGERSAGMFLNPQALNRFFGREYRVEPEYYTIPLKKHDQLLLCTDGLSNFLMEPEIIQAMTKNKPQEASDLMERKLLSKKVGAPDNFTWYIIQI